MKPPVVYGLTVHDSRKALNNAIKRTKNAGVVRKRQNLKCRWVTQVRVAAGYHEPLGIQMITSNRTSSSLAQILCLLKESLVFVLLDKHNIGFHCFDEIGLSAALPDDCSNEERASLFDELVRTKGDLRSRISPKYRFDERWEDLEKCLLLDGYRIEGKTIHKIEPFLEGNETVLDDLVKEI